MDEKKRGSGTVSVLRDFIPKIDNFVWKLDDFVWKLDEFDFGAHRFIIDVELQSLSMILEKDINFGISFLNFLILFFLFLSIIDFPFVEVSQMHVITVTDRFQMPKSNKILRMGTQIIFNHSIDAKSLQSFQYEI